LRASVWCGVTVIRDPSGDLTEMPNPREGNRYVYVGGDPINLPIRRAFSLDINASASPAGDRVDIGENGKLTPYGGVGAV
jgi:hypothetical protein